MAIKKKLKITAFTIIAVMSISAVVIFVIFNVLKISYNTSEKNEIESSITITRDSKGIPTIETEAVNDFYFALGYLHAKDRINVIEYLRAIATANSSKYAGSSVP